MSFDIALIDGDIKIQKDGSIKTYTDTPKLRQDIIKILLTTIGSNSIHPWYGCNLGNEYVARNIPDSIVFSSIEDSVIESLNNIIKLQKYQAGYQELSSAEIISKVLSVSAARNPVDMRQIDVKIIVLSKRLTKIEEVITITS